MSESADTGKLSGLARSIDALFAAPATPATVVTPAAPPTLITPVPAEPEGHTDPIRPKLQETMMSLAPSVAPSGERPRRPEMFPATQMVDAIQADAPAGPTVVTPAATELSLPDLAGISLTTEAEPADEAPLTFSAPSASPTEEPPHEVTRDDIAREGSPEEFAEAVEAVVAGEHGERERVESLAAALRERLALDPLADGVERLVRAAGDPPDPWLVEVAGSVINPAVASRLVQRMGHESDESGRAEYFALCRRLGGVMANALKGALTGATGREVRRIYYDALISMGDASRPVIEKMLGDENRFLVRDAVAILGEIGGPRAVELVTSALADTDARVRVEALRALGKLGDAESGQLVLALLEDSDSDVRLAAAAAAGELELARALKPLLHMLEGENDPDTCVALLRALGQIKDPGAVPAIEKRAVPSMFSKSSTDVRVAAYRALHQIGSPHARELVQHASRDKDAGVRVALRDLARAN